MKKVINKIFIYIFMLIIIFISVIPFVYMVMMSFKSTTNAYDFDFSLEKLTLMQYQKFFPWLIFQITYLTACLLQLSV